MKTLLRFMIYSIILLLPWTSGAAATLEDERIALVIGNGNYKSSPLANPVNDANDMADLLETFNFKVMKVINADRREMRRAIRKFGDMINRSKNVGLFYYAGHGLQVDGENYLVPIGAEVHREDEVEDECLKISSVLRKMDTAGNLLNIIILDACRDNPLGRSFRSSSRGLAKMDAPQGSILAYATGPGSVAEDGVGRNGLYTSKLLKHMKTPNIEIGRMFRRVRVEVIKASGEKQVPWETLSLTGDFYFHTQRGITVTDRPASKPTISTKKKAAGVARKSSAGVSKSGPTAEKKTSAVAAEAAVEKTPEVGLVDRAIAVVEKTFTKEDTREAQSADTYTVVKKATTTNKANNSKSYSAKLAYVPKTVTAAPMVLRSEGKKMLDTGNIRKMLAKNNFFETSLNPNGTFVNNFVDNKDDTVTDLSTGLMWQKGGSSRRLHHDRLRGHIKRLNKKAFAGHSNWRVPTLEEISSIISRTKINGLYLDPLFDTKQSRCWSSDRRRVSDFYHGGGWMVSFTYGQINKSQREELKVLNPDTFRDYNYVRAVRRLNP